MSSRQPDPNDLRTFYWRLQSVGQAFRVTRLLVVANCLVFLAMVTLGGADLFAPSMEIVTAWGSNFGPLTIGGQWTRLFTAMFLHIGLIHLAVNMWSLYQTGALVERLFGSLHFLVLYLVAGLAGNLASLLWNPLVDSAGASGAVFGVIGGLLAFVMDTRYGVPRSVIVDVRRSVLGVVAINLAFGFTMPGIDNAAHLGGLAGGLAAGLLLARPLDGDWRRQHRLAGIGVTLGAAAVLLLGGATLLNQRLSSAQRDSSARPSRILPVRERGRQSGPGGARPAPALQATAGLRGGRAQSRSKIAAMPWPPPMHIVTSA